MEVIMNQTAPVGGQIQPQQKSGCMKFLLIGCIALIIIGVVAMIATYFGLKYIAKYGTDKAAEWINEELVRIPDGTPGREELKDAVKSAIEGLKNGTTSADEITSMTNLISRARSDGTITADEIQIITKYMREASASKTTVSPPSLPIDSPPSESESEPTE
jgi:hypothetical protein